MKRSRALPGAIFLVLFLAQGSLSARPPEVATVESATEVLQTYAAIPLKGIPPALLQDAKGVAIIPNSVKLGFVIGGRFGRGVILVRQPDGSWGNPIFITLAGGGIGWQAGVQSTDIILVFKTSSSLTRILNGKGKLTLGADVAVAVGPVGRQAEAGTDGQLKAEIYSYSRSRGLFAGISLEGAGLLIDFGSNEAFYRLGGGLPADVMQPGLPVPLPAVQLKAQLTQMSAPLPPPVVVYPPQTPPPPPPPQGPPPPVVYPPPPR
jgi:lipid-binding SYLF domain-containing protein